MNGIISLDVAAALIQSGRVLVLGGSADVLVNLPSGRWIGGVTHSFLSESGCVSDAIGVHALDLTDYIASPVMQSYSYLSVGSLFEEIPEDGFSFALMPAFSEAHRMFSIYSALEPVELRHRVCGWVAGINLPSRQAEEVFIIDGMTGEIFWDNAVVLHCSLREGYDFCLDVYNPYDEVEGDSFQFSETTFSITDCLVNGAPGNFYDYLRQYAAHDIPTLQAQVGGAKFNVHVAVDNGMQHVMLTTPVISGIDYRMVRLYEQIGQNCLRFLSRESVPEGTELVTSLSCLGLFARMCQAGCPRELVPGVFSFGEIAHYLHNEVVVRMRIARS